MTTNKQALRVLIEHKRKMPGIQAATDADVLEALLDELEAAEKRIAELEARQVNEEVSDEELNAALQLHRLKVDGHSQLSDAFRVGFKYARRAAGITVKGE